MVKWHLDPQLYLDKSLIPVVDETKCQVVIFDRKLYFVPHLKYIKMKGLKVLNISMVIGNTEWGAHRKVVLQLNRSLVRSKLGNGCTVYGSVRRSFLQMLDPIHNQGLVALHTSVESLNVGVHEPCLGAKHVKLSLQYASKIKLLLKHPTHNAVFDNKHVRLTDARPNAIVSSSF